MSTKPVPSTRPTHTASPVAVARPDRPAVARVRRWLGLGWLYLGLSLLGVLTALPFIAMILLAVRPRGAISLRELFFSTALTLDNFTQVLGSAALPRWIANSFIYALVSVVLVLLLASLAGYAFAKKRFWGQNALFWSFVAMLMVPSQISIVPLFILLARLDGVNTYWGLIVPTLANAQGVFLMRQFIMGIPDELIEAAKIDGASEWRIYWQIILPLTTPVLATLGIFVFLWHWNDFLWPLIVAQSDDMRTLTVGLATLQAMVPSTAQLMAAAAISFIPNLLIFVLFQRYIVQSIATSGLKS